MPAPEGLVALLFQMAWLPFGETRKQARQEPAAWAATWSQQARAFARAAVVLEGQVASPR